MEETHHFMPLGYKAVNHTETGMKLNVERYNGEQPRTYIYGFYWSNEGEHHQEAGSVVIKPRERHILTYRGPGDFSIRIEDYYDDKEVQFEGEVEGLPSDYRSDLGVFRWTGQYKD